MRIKIEIGSKAFALVGSAKYVYSMLHNSMLNSIFLFTFSCAFLVIFLCLQYAIYRIELSQPFLPNLKVLHGCFVDDYKKEEYIESIVKLPCMGIYGIKPILKCKLFV